MKTQEPINLDATDGCLQVEKHGDGNSARHDIVVKGTQYNLSEFERLGDGFLLSITGEWEFDDFIEGLVMARYGFKPQDVALILEMAKLAKKNENSNYFGKDCDCTYHCEKCDPTWSKKGELEGRCNRAVCAKTEQVVFFNHSTRKHYCKACAITINEANKIDAFKLYSHDLCITEDGLTPDELIRKEIIDAKKEGVQDGI